MKIRNGFVANSSSSSYTCNVCSRTEIGWDLGLSEADMERCINDHIFCLEHATMEGMTAEEKKAHLLEQFRESGYMKDEIKELEPLEGTQLEYWLDNDGYDLWYEWGKDSGVPEKYCPICQFLEVSNYDMARYLQKRTGITRESVFAKVKTTNKRREGLYDTEYMSIVCLDRDINLASSLADLKARFGTYKAFRKWIDED